MEKHYLIFGYWFACGLSDGMPANQESIDAWDAIKPHLLHNENAKMLIIDIEDMLQTEGYRDRGN